MEPREALPGPSTEVGINRAPETPQPTGERPAVTPEQPKNAESREAAPSPPIAAPAPAQAAMPTLPPPQADNARDDAAASQTGTPLAASDDGLIEKEWVDKAKKIVAQTRDDPYQQEKEVSRLQADYLKKRYGKEIKLSSN